MTMPKGNETGRPDELQPAQRCEELECGRGFECVHVRRGAMGRAMCMRMKRNQMCQPVRMRPDNDRERPGNEPGGGERPGNEPGGGERTGNETGGERPDNGIGGERPGNETGGERPGNETGGERPGNETGGERPGNETGGERPGNETGGERPGNETGGERPGNGDMSNEQVFPLNAPDLCLERKCCEGESCFARRLAQRRQLVAFCAAVSFTITTKMFVLYSFSNS